MTVVAGVDVGNATTEVAFLDGGRLVGVDRVPTRGHKGSADSLRAAAALVRRLERRLGCRVGQARVAPLRPVDTTTLTIPAAPPATGRLRLIAAGAATPGGAGAWAGVPLWLDRPLPPGRAGLVPSTARALRIPIAAGEAGHARAAPGLDAEHTAGPPAVAMVPADFGYARAAERLRALLGAGVPIGAVLAGGDEGVLIFNRLSAPVPVIDQVDLAAIAGCDLVAVEVRPPGDPLTLLADPVALAAAFSLPANEAGDAAVLCRTLVDFSNAVVGRATADGAEPGRRHEHHAPDGGPWVVAAGERVTLRSACALIPGWPVGTVRTLGAGAGWALRRWSRRCAG